MTEPLLVSPRLSYVERVIQIPDVELFDLSSDGQTALVLSNRTGSYQLALVPTSGGPLRAVSHGNDRVTWARISNDSRQVAFTRDFSGREAHQFYTAPLAREAEEKQLTQLSPTRVSHFNWSHIDETIAFTGATGEANGVWLLDPETGKTNQIYSHKHWVFDPQWSPDDTKITVSAKTTEHPTAMELVTLDPHGLREPIIYTPKEGSENSLGEYNPHQPHLLLFKTDARGRYDLAVHQLEAQPRYLKAGELGLGLDFPVFGWMPDGDAVYYLANKNGRTGLYTEQLEGSAPPEEIPLPTGFHAGFLNTSIKPANSGEFFVFSWSSLSSPPSLSRYNLKTSEVETLNEHFTDLPLGQAEQVTYNSFDGRQIHGWFLKPAHQAGKRPCILWIHGGPAWEVADAWNPAIQSFLVAGYTLFAPNIRGSTGYGVEFQNLNIHDVGGGDLRDVEEAAKYLRSRPEVDPMRIALVGASYGGYMTNLGMTKLPEYWAAGASIVGITDWKEMYDLSDALFRSFIERYFGTPEENPELYQTRSPINYVQNIRAPLLIWHRGNDSRCPLAPVEKFAARLKQLNKNYEMKVVWDEGHGFQKTENLARQYKAIVQFLDKQLGPPS